MATQSQVITGVDVINVGSDRSALRPMREQHEQRYGQPPRELLVDGGFVKKGDLDQLTPPTGQTTIYTPKSVGPGAVPRH